MTTSVLLEAHWIYNELYCSVTTPQASAETRAFLAIDASQSRLETWLSTRGDKYILHLQVDLYSSGGRLMICCLWWQLIISAMSSVDSLSPKTYPVESNSRSYIDSKFTCPTHTLMGQTISEAGGGGCPHLSIEWCYCFKVPVFPH